MTELNGKRTSGEHYLELLYLLFKSVVSAGAILSSTACRANSRKTWSERALEPAACRPLCTEVDSSIFRRTVRFIWNATLLNKAHHRTMLRCLDLYKRFSSGRKLRTGTFVPRRTFWMWLNFVFNRCMIRIRHTPLVLTCTCVIIFFSVELTTVV